MKNTFLIRALSVALMALCLAFTGLAGCVGGDMATVTIKINHPNFDQTYSPSFFDRVIAFFSLSSRAEAGNLPQGLEFERIRLFVTGPTIAPIRTQIPMSEGAITLSVPSGKNILFRVKADGMGGIDNPTYDYAGEFTTTLVPGESKEIAIEMRPAIYMGGYKGEDACYWINGTFHPLGANCSINDLTVFNNTVYSAGYLDEINWQASYWTNQDSYGLDDGSASSIFVTSENIYIGVNTEHNGSGYYITGDYKKLTDSGGYVNSISVYNGKVYVCGSDSGNSVYWIDGKKTEIGDSLDNQLTGMFIWRGDVYLSGNTQNQDSFRPCYFKNTKRYYLEDESTPASATGIVVAEGDVYVSGYIKIETDRYQACYWKNGNRIDMPLDHPDYSSSMANAIAVKDGDVYLAGYFQASNDFSEAACFWKNGTRFDLDDDEVNGSSASCLFVY